VCSITKSNLHDKQIRPSNDGPSRCIVWESQIAKSLNHISARAHATHAGVRRTRAGAAGCSVQYRRNGARWTPSY
jgi:hypothetical protein